MTLDLWFFLLAGPATLFAGVSKAGFGSGAAFAASSLLALVIEPGLALGVMLPLLMLIDVASLRAYWRKWSGRDAGLMIAGAVPGVIMGALLYRMAEPDLLRLLIGGISIGFVCWQIAVKRGWVDMARHRLPAGAGVLAGLVAGFTSFVSHAGGPPAAVYLLSRGLNKTPYQATTVLVFWVVNILKFVPYAFLGMFTLQTVQANLVLAPFALAGTWLGVRAHGMLSERVFFTVTYVALTLTGGKLIWDALT